MSKDTTKKAKAKTAVAPKKAPVKKANPLLEEETDEETETEVEETDEDVADTDTEETEDEESEDDEVEEEEEVAPKKAPAKSKASSVVTQDVAPVRANSPLEKQALTDIEMTKRKLALQPKVRIIVPLGIGEKKGVATENVNINGYRLTLKKGEYINVPQAVATQIEQHYNMGPETSELGEEFRLDRSRTKDGVSTDDALLNG